MEFSDICKAFYIGQGKSGFKNYKSKKKIAMHFMRLAVKEENQVAMRQSESTYINWANGDSSPREDIWANFRDKYVEADYVKGLKDSFSDTYINDVAEKLGISIPAGENVNKHKFALAIAKQMQVIADNNNRNVADVIRATYTYQGTNISFSEYRIKAIDRYNKMKLIGGQEVPLCDYFVCNTIGDSQRFMSDKSQYKGLYLDDATVESIRNLYKDSGKKQYREFDNKKCILIGSGGSGKTLMLQHLFLAAVDNYPDTGVLPVFLELRNFTQSDTVESFLRKTVLQKDSSFTEGILDQMLEEGKCVVLMDGIDEIDPNDVGSFQMKLEEFTDKYNNTQVILSSRMCDAVIGLKGYVTLYVWPFDSEQAERLIDKILIAEEKTEAKESVLEYLNHGFLGNESIFATHPMLLTFVVRNYPSFDRFKESRVLFYRKAYEALLSGHDDNKKPYDRVFHSVDDAEQFTEVFREFCAKTYQDAVFKFSPGTFGSYYSRLEVQKSFANPKKMTEKHFLQDACATACVMYEENDNIFYIDSGFQEFLFAEYYSRAKEDQTEALRKILMSKPINLYGGLDAMKMMYELVGDKVEKCISYPFLKEIFKDSYSEKEKFIHFLSLGFDEIRFLYIDRNTINRVIETSRATDYRFNSIENEPVTIILTALMDSLELPTTCSFDTEDQISELSIVVGEEMNGMMNEDPQTGQPIIMIINNHFVRMTENISDTKDIFKEPYKGDLKNHTEMVQDRLLELQFGMEYKIDTYDIEDNPDTYDSLITKMMEGDNSFFRVYVGLKEYYKVLNRKNRRGEFN